MKPLLEVNNLRKYFESGGFLSWRKKKYAQAVDDISFNIYPGETLALVGESGCGKSTTGKLLLRLIEPTSGSVQFDGVNIYTLNEDQLRSLRRKMQIIFQDPFASLNPRKTVRQILLQPYELLGHSEHEAEENMQEMLRKVGLNPPGNFLQKHPHELSGGQRQRCCLARAIALKPNFVVADEPVSSLDMSVRGQILNLMKQLQKDFGLTYLFITHDLSIVRSLATRVAVMYLGKIVELCQSEELFTNPIHPYTRALISSTPRPNPRMTRSKSRFLVGGDIPSPIDPPSACRFHTRCPCAMAKCATIEPTLIEFQNGHFVSCHTEFLPWLPRNQRTIS